jgi:hypothetical protein
VRYEAMAEEPLIPAVGEEALRGTPQERIDEMARAIQREPLKFVFIAAIVGFAVALAVR